MLAHTHTHTFAPLLYPHISSHFASFTGKRSEITESRLCVSIMLYVSVEFFCTHHFETTRENQNSLKRNRHLCKSDSRFISAGNGVNVADKKLIEIKSSPINHCVWSSFFSHSLYLLRSFWHFTFNLFADIIFLVL